ncbi:aminopeptidase RNPEPL1 isoform X2 [Sphaeramia orbicularis]|uniref:Peptidase M1 leukotriene A4 hydrolase/aminopeptidase C-terminal domain-containing protein n=1 Tax=Sphaeramia orbicularis TaxID=375764 RepID=A0A672YN96_9TELE|nr:aminopeptidase RNPEPL1 isoform X2 [Sphaeramia orbicularis]
MADLQQTPTSLCCCRKALPVSGVSGAPGGRCVGDSGRPLGGPGGRRCPLVDVASTSNFSCFRLNHLHLDLRLNFAVKEMSGWLVLDLVPVQPGVQSLVLDSHPSLLIHSIDCKVPGSGQEDPMSLTYRVDPFTDYGSALNISLPEAAVGPGRLIQVTVRYTTTDGPAIWWLDSELTCGQSRPLVFTQGHSVCNRSFFPCFDTPAVKSTYTATVRVPDGVTVLMSASRSLYSKQDRVFQFSMEHPVPSYLVALVAGELQHVDVGPRSRVWAEPCLLSCAVQKLGGSVERWLGVAEELFGPYLWGRCDIVFLPPSFPIVAMENPCLTFIIASILESSEFLLIDVIHEIAHGWFGNAVTNATWEEMWLSEGLATYAQRRITTEAYGEAFTCLETAVRLDALHRQLRLLGDNNPVSKLQVKFEPGVNPSTLMNLFTYEKGFCFVSYLSQLSGDVRRFDSFLRDYISEFKFKSVVAQDLIDFFLRCFPELRDTAVTQREGLEFDRWLNGSGPPPYEPDLSGGGALTRPVQDLCELWRTGDAPDLQAVMTFDLSTWSTFQIVLFLDRMLDHSPLAHDVMLSLSGCYSSLFDGLNAEVQIRWLQMVVRNTFYPELPRVRAFLQKHTSRMYTVPLYEDLVAGVMKCVAVEIFYQTQRRLHPNLRRTLQQILFQTNQNGALPTNQNGAPPTNQNGAPPTNQNGPTLSVINSTPSSQPSNANGTSGAIALRDVNVSA